VRSEVTHEVCRTATCCISQLTTFIRHGASNKNMLAVLSLYPVSVLVSFEILLRFEGAC
jgi:hypothetical protein